MESNQKTKLLEQLIQSLELPDSAYEKAVRRYEDLGAWFDRDDSKLKYNAPHIFPQGSFRLGTAIKPLNQDESYDLDLACNIRKEISTSTHSQEYLKDVVGEEIESYRVARRIQAEKEEKHRCWRLEYADDVNFHMDVVPCIPESENIRQQLSESMQKHGLNLEIASNLSSYAICITDNTHKNYSGISDNWQISNPEGYANWFEAKMSVRLLKEAMSVKAQVDEVPTFKRKTPLQRIVQLLKRHRDTMFVDAADLKPISVIITTIAAQSYSGTASLQAGLQEVLSALTDFANSNSDEVLNPVNPAENFADKWTNPEYKKYNLKSNFHNWVYEVNRHFNLLLTTNDVQKIVEVASGRFAFNRSANEWAEQLGMSIAPTVFITPSKNIDSVQAKPWCKE
ncbi:MAG TPA: nucleotidyltransferase [Methylotenera sp.]|nr:nucleotidyltransferase [Methylotenera sp.]